MDIDDSEPMDEEEPEKMDSLQMNKEQEYPNISKFLKIVNFSYNDQPNISEEIMQYLSNKENKELLEHLFQNYRRDFEFIEEFVIPNNEQTMEVRQQDCQALIDQILQSMVISDNDYSSSTTNYDYDILSEQNFVTSNSIPIIQTTSPIYTSTGNQRVKV
jgi:hypothetical protein